jgi:twitching motility protein PilT
MFDVDAALRYLIQAEGSDLHLKVPMPPIVRVHGQLTPVEGGEPLKPADTERVLRYMLTDPSKLDEFDKEGEVDFAYAIEGLARFRVNAFRQRGSISLVCRAIPYSIRTIEQLNLPPVIRTLAEEERGIVLLTGTTGSGKSTTLAAMIDHMNQTVAKHVVTIEDPIEFLHRDRNSVINQREVGLDTTSFKRALRRVLRQDPDVILIGEMRDEETVQAALSAAETGHLVLSTVHTVDATESINRMLDFFPPHQHQQVRAMIAGTLKGVVSQRLIPSADGRGRVAVCEVLVMTGRVRDMVTDPTQTGRLHEVIQEGEFYGMQTFDQALLGHVQAGRVSMEEALKASTHPHDFRLLVAAEGRRSTSMVDVAPRPDAEDHESPGASSNGHGNGQPAPASPPAPPAPVTPLAPSRPDPDPDPTNPPPAPPDSPSAASADARGSAGSVPPPGAA